MVCALRTGTRRSLLMLMVLGACGLSVQAQQGSNSLVPQADLPDAPGFGGASQTGSGAGGAQAGPAAPATLSGTVVDPNGGVVQGARVVLTDANPDDLRVEESGSNGQFTFSGLAPETYKVTVTGPGMGTVVLPNLSVRAGETRFLPALVLPVNAGVTEVRVVGNEKQIEEEEAE
ncbi:MAG: carboxypeptidase-like regulatory domain-containing protein, partial [Acidobacteriaceae bacterium]